MEQFWQEIVADWPDMHQFLQIVFRLGLAALLGAIPGWQREATGVAAGLRTHMMVSLGAAVYVMAVLEAGATVGDSTRVIQGLVTGIGFIGGGAILKSSAEQQVKGVTTASSIWLTAGLGTAAGLGRVWLPIFATVLGLFILSALQWISERITPQKPFGGLQTPSD